MALLLSLARNVPQAHASLIGGTLGALEVQRHRALRARRSGSSASAASASSSPQRAQRLRHERHRLRPVRRGGALPRARRRACRRAPTRSTRRPTSSRSTCRRPPRPSGWLERRGVREDASDGVRILNVARGPLLVDEDLKAALDSGKVGGAALDVFQSEPITDHPLFGYPNVVVTPHLGASTAEATDRAGYQAAEQVVAALTGGTVTTRGQRAGGRRARTSRCWGRSCRSPRASARSPSTLGDGDVGRRDRGRVPRPDRRARHAPAHDRRVLGRARGPHRGGGQRRQRADARRGARASPCSRAPATTARDFTDLVRVTVVSGDDRSTRRRHRRSAAATGRTCSRRGASASTSSSSRTWRSSATATSRG